MSILQHLNAISNCRLTPYRQLCRNGSQTASPLIIEKKAICLYTALQHRASIFSSLIQEIEISVRNEMAQLIKKNTPNGDLLNHFCYLAINNTTTLSTYSKNELNSCLIKLLNKAINNPGKNIKFLNNQNYAYQQLQKYNISADDIIASMTFGFWVNLIDSNTKRNPHYLHWNNMFYCKLFDNRFNTIQKLFDDLRDVRDFRNRLSHQDCIWNKSARTPKEALKNLHDKYIRFSMILDNLSPNRYSFRTISTYLSWQESLNFDYDIFIAEIEQMIKISFI